jgi:hypothetical protein
MPKYDKLLSKVRLGPKHVTMTELIKLMELLDFSSRRGSKNHYMFYRDGLIVGVAPPHPGRFVKPIYVKHCLRAIEELLNNEQNQ